MQNLSMAVNVVLGAGGPTGQECVKRLLAASDLPVRAVVREPSKYAEVLPKSEKLEIVAGDVTDKASLQGALKGAKGIIFAASGKGYWSASSVDFQGVKNAAEVAKQLNADQFVLVSSMLVSPHNRFHPIRIMLNNFRWSLMDNKYKGEQELRSSGVPYTIVRPSGLGSGPPGKAEIITGQGDRGLTGGRSISRADVAAICVAALNSPASKNVTVEVTSKAEEVKAEAYEQHLKDMWGGLKADAGK